ALDKCFGGIDVTGFSITTQEQYGASYLWRQFQSVWAVIKIIDERLCTDDPPPAGDLHQIAALTCRDQFAGAHTEFFKTLTGHQSDLTDGTEQVPATLVRGKKYERSHIRVAGAVLRGQHPTVGVTDDDWRIVISRRQPAFSLLVVFDHLINALVCAARRLSR